MTISHLEHHHHANMNMRVLNRAFIVGISLNLLFVLTEFGAGLWVGSLALLSDAGHNLSDVISLALSMLAFRLAKVKASEHYTYGYKKSTVLVSLLNAVILLIVVGGILIECIRNLANPTQIEGDVIAWVAGVGIIINGVTALLFLRDKERDLNVKGAYLHMMADALVSIGVLVSGIIIQYTGWNIIDPIIGMAVAIIILISTWELLTQSLRLSLDGVPVGVDISAVGQVILSVPEVVSYHHLHVWALSTNEIALTVHVVARQLDSMEQVKHELKHQLEHIGIHHATLEIETDSEHCEDEQDH